jgi:PilZ domain-containing protein
VDDLQLQIARKILPELPTELNGWSIDGGGLAVAIDSISSEGRLSGRMSSFDVRDGMHLVIPINLVDGGGYDIVCEVVGRYYRSGLEASIEMTVLGVERRKPFRAEPRAALNELCLLKLKSRRPALVEFEGKIVDVSLGGVGVTTTRRLESGDRVEIATQLGSEELRCDLVVVYTEPAAFGRYRSGCRILTTTPRAAGVIGGYLEAHGPLTGAPSHRRGRRVA